MKQAVCSLCATLVLTLFAGALTSSSAQTASATPEPFVTQLTSSPDPASVSIFRSNASDISGDGRFVVFESNGDVATERTLARNNSDGNREIFLFDYAQRRVFQITDTKNVPKPTPTPSPTPSPSPSPSPAPTPADPTQIQIEISNNRPMISQSPVLNASNRRVYVIVFSSNAPNPALFNGVDTGGVLAADGNQELWIYEVPEVADADLTSGANLPLQPLSGGVFTQITNTPASRVPTPGAAGVAPFVADDNREATISDNGNIIAFISTRNLVPAVGNTDGNPELFFFQRSPAAMTQGTNTQDSFVGATLFSVFQQNPSLSGDGSVVAFLSSGNFAGNNDDDGAGHGNAEIYVANFSGTAISNIRQATRTRLGNDASVTTNLFSPGRRLSRDGAFLAFETLAEDPKANSTATNQIFLAVFVYTIATDTFTRVSQRATTGFGDIIHFPTFTDYTGLVPGTLVFASSLNLRTDGTIAPSDQASNGLNPNLVAQVFATQVPVTSTNTFVRLTKTPALTANDFFAGIRPLASFSRQRLTFSLGGIELGTGNPDRTAEVFYLLSPPVTTESTATLSFFTGASLNPLPDTPAPSPSPSPIPSPSPGIPIGLAAGELGVLRASADFVSSDATANGGSETTRSPALPIELNGVSVSVNGAAAGLYFVGQSSRQINFVLPLGLSTGVATVVINSRFNGGTQLRGFILIVAAQPDIFTTTNGPGGRALVCNITNPLVMGCVGEPFPVMSLDSTGTSVPTVLQINLTGVRGATPAETRVTIGTTDITGTAILRVRPNTEMPGWDFIEFTLPASLAGSTDVPIIVTITRTGAAAFSSRPAATAPLITISP